MLSGLAGGVVGAANWASHLDLDKVVSFDIGGTSTDIALIRDLGPAMEKHAICGEGKATGGLAYVAYGDGTCGVKGIGTATDTVIKLPETNNGMTVVAIEADAFEGNTTITKIELTAKVTRIGDGAFHGCTALKTISMNLSGRGNLQTIGNAAFADCTALTTITFPVTLTAIGDWAFSGCTGVTKVEKLDAAQVATIGAGAFYGCVGLTSFKIPATVVSVGDRAFEACSNLASVTVEAVKAEGATKATSRLTSIGAGAFRGCRQLATVNFGANSVLQTVGEKAFENCSVLASITLPKNVKMIGAGAFKGCSALTSVTIEVEAAASGQPQPLCKWSVTNSADKLDTVQLVVENATDAATALKVTYLNYVWNRI